MKIVVCAKQVAFLGDEFELTSDGRAVDPGYLDRALNEWDAYTTEAALRLVEEHGGEVVIVTCGDDEADAAVLRCLAMGAVRGVRVWSEALLGADPITVARALAGVIRGESADLVLCGVQSSDSVNGATGVALAELLGLPWVAVVTRVEIGDGHATCRRELEGGLIDVCDVATPAVITIQTGPDQPRYATLRAIKHAEQRGVEVVAPNDLGEPACRVRRLFVGAKGDGAEMMGSDPAEIAARIHEIVRARVV
jgi:electron transfer flavoprotein alpha/beta subunit